MSGGASALVLFGEGHADYAVAAGAAACALAELCHVTYEPNRTRIYAGAASMIVVGVAGFWFMHRLQRRWKLEDAKFSVTVEKN
jgi:hypothetical protein